MYLFYSRFGRTMSTLPEYIRQLTEIYNDGGKLVSVCLSVHLSAYVLVLMSMYELVHYLSSG